MRKTGNPSQLGKEFVKTDTDIGAMAGGENADKPPQAQASKEDVGPDHPVWLLVGKNKTKLMASSEQNSQINAKIP